jgi:hypothetical protein
MTAMTDRAGANPDRRPGPGFAALRIGLLLLCAVQAVFAIAFIVQWPPAVGLWPFPGTTPLTHILVGAFFAAAATSTTWATGTRQYAALAGIGLDYLVALAPVATLLYQLSRESATFVGPAVICTLAALSGLGVLLWALRTPVADPRTMPIVVQGSFALFVVALLIAGGNLIVGGPEVIPWRITPALAVFIGWLFIGSAAYFAHALLRPDWVHSAGPLVGFLAYDVVLIGPLLTRFASVPPEQRLSLWIYTAVVVYSGLLAAYFLMIHGPTRIWPPRSLRASPEQAS